MRGGCASVRDRGGPAIEGMLPKFLAHAKTSTTLLIRETAAFCRGTNSQERDVKPMLTLCACACFCGTTAAHADYTLTATSAGASSAMAAPGSDVKIEIQLTSDASDVCNSAIYRVEFSAPGLQYMGYLWTSPFESGLFDDSFPQALDLPAILDDNSLDGVGYPVGVVDIELSNVTTSGVFATGMLTSLEFHVPADWSGAESVEITVVPDTFANGFTTIPATAGSTFTLLIPSPSVGPLAVVTLVLGTRRRR